MSLESHASAPQVKDASELRVVVFRLGDEVFGANVHQVREIIKIREFTKIPNAPSYVRGVINLRGQITTILDLRRLLGMSSEEIGSDARIIILDSRETAVGVIVDVVLGVMRMAQKDIEPPPKIADTSAMEFINGVAKNEKNLIILLDLEKLLEKSLKGTEQTPELQELLSKQGT